MPWNSGRAFQLRHLRQEKGWSQNDLATAAKVTRRAVSAAESGVSEIGRAFFASVCSVLDVRPERFACFADPESR